MDGNIQDLNQAKQLEEMKRALLQKILTKEAFERLGRVRAANPQLASQAELYLLNIYQAGRLKQRVQDAQMREVLSLLSEKKDFNIKYR